MYFAPLHPPHLGVCLPRAVCCLVTFLSNIMWKRLVSRISCCPNKSHAGGSSPLLFPGSLLYCFLAPPSTVSWLSPLLFPGSLPYCSLAPPLLFPGSLPYCSLAPSLTVSWLPPLLFPGSLPYCFLAPSADTERAVENCHTQQLTNSRPNHS